MRFKAEDLATMTARVAKQAGAPVQRLPRVATPAAASVPGTPGVRLQALGRLKPGEMNKTEARFLEGWIKPRMLTRELDWWAFEAVTLKLAPDCRLTVDFFVKLSTGALQAYDVKGALAIISDDAKVKMKLAADRFPWPFFYAIPKKVKDGGGWEVRAV